MRVRYLIMFLSVDGLMKLCKDTHYVDISPYADKPVPVIKSLFKYWLETALWHKPTVLILDNLHELLGTESEVCHISYLLNAHSFFASQQSDSFRTRHITEIFLSIYSSSARSASINCRGIILLATAPSSAALHPLISTAHIFEEVVNVTPPNKDARRDVRAFHHFFTPCLRRYLRSFRRLSKTV